MGNPLEISELRLLICRELYTTDLGALRLTCKRWSPEAEQEMWSRVFRLLPLLRLIPEDAWLEGETVSTLKLYRRQLSFRFIRPLTPQDWIPVMKRARFVKRQWFMDLTTLEYLEGQVDAILACPPPSLPLFPNMRDLRVNYDSRCGPAYQHLAHILFPQSALNSISGVACNTRFFDPANLAANYQDLAEISLTVGDSHYHRSDVMPESAIAQRYEVRLAGALAACRSLSHVTLSLDGSVAPEIIVALSRSRSIQSVSLLFHDLATDHIRIPASYSFPRFPALRSFGLSGLTLERAWRLLQGSGRDAPGSIFAHQNAACRFNAPLFVETGDALLCTMRSIHDQYTPYRSLRSLSLDGSHPPMNINFSDIEMFSVFPHINHFALDFEFEEVSITDSNCEAFASWWPDLRHFSIGGSASPAVRTAPPALTLRALLAFVQRCPQFACLALPMDATVVPIVQPDAKGRAPRYWGLEELTLKDSDIGSGDELGAWMAESFPGLRNLYYSLPNEEHGDVDRRIEEWNRVKLLTTGRTEF
ncbi:hypothetical protein K525DRAFT_210270 [Schizophyllum commune Loenen D]|nr:hypothetical protein K525DRAFT_210270 [Schizophyllum commune Loenen D]